MSITEEQYQLIVKFLDQTLSPVEEKVFDATMNNSASFRKEVEQMEVLTAGIKAVEKLEEIDQIKEVFKEFDQEEKSSKRIPLFSIPIGLGIAASVSLIAFLAYFGFFRTSSAENDTVYNEYFEIFPANVEMRSGNNAAKGIALYSNGKYAEAIPILEELSKSSKDVLVPVYLANAYMQVQNPEEAIYLLKGYSETASNGYSIQFYRWYLGLALLKAGKSTESKEIFTLLAKQNGIYQLKSKEILKKLE